MMRKGFKLILAICLILMLVGVFSLVVAANGPPLKENGCAVCHKDGRENSSKDPAVAGTEKFSDKIHKIHQGGKTKLECNSCHAL